MVSQFDHFKRLAHMHCYDLDHFCLDSLYRTILRWKGAKIAILVGWKPAQRLKMHKIAIFCEFSVHQLIIFVAKLHSNCNLANTKMFVRALALRCKPKTRLKIATRMTSIGPNVKNDEKMAHFLGILHCNSPNMLFRGIMSWQKLQIQTSQTKPHHQFVAYTEWEKDINLIEWLLKSKKRKNTNVLDKWFLL